jgi:hypothetical protein
LIAGRSGRLNASAKETFDRLRIVNGDFFRIGCSGAREIEFRSQWDVVNLRREAVGHIEHQFVETFQNFSGTEIKSETQ